MGEPPFGIFIKGLGQLLKEGEGVVVHFEGKGYIVHRDSEMLHVLEDESYLTYPDGSLAWMHDEPVGNA